MMSAFQLFAQPIFESVESWLKAWRIQRERRAASGAGAAAPAPAPAMPPAKAGSVARTLRASPFDAIAEEPSEQKGSKLGSHTPSRVELVADDALGGGRLMSVRASDVEGLTVRNSVPIPDLLPSGGWVPRRRSSAVAAAASWRSGLAVSRASMYLVDTGERLQQWLGWRVRSGTGRACRRPTVPPVAHPPPPAPCCAGATNEHVPLNETGYLLPLWQVRSVGWGEARCWAGSGVAGRQPPGIQPLLSAAPSARSVWSSARSTWSCFLCLQLPCRVSGARGAGSVAAHLACCCSGTPPPRCRPSPVQRPAHARAVSLLPPLHLQLPAAAVFTSIVGLVGSLCYFPLNILFPVWMWGTVRFAGFARGR